MLGENVNLDDVRGRADHAVVQHSHELERFEHLPHRPVDLHALIPAPKSRR